MLVVEFAPFIGAALAILLTPGPTNTILAASSAAMGIRNALFLPLAEAAGYAIAISAFLAAARLLADVDAVLPVLKGIAAAWLLFSAWKLWRQPVSIDTPRLTLALRRVFLTTLLNPKAMLVGTIMIPAFVPSHPILGVATFIVVSTAAGGLWLTLGSALPNNFRPMAYKIAAVVIGCFSVGAAASAMHLVAAA